MGGFKPKNKLRRQQNYLAIKKGMPARNPLDCPYLTATPKPGKAKREMSVSSGSGRRQRTRRFEKSVRPVTFPRPSRASEFGTMTTWVTRTTRLAGPSMSRG